MSSELQAIKPARKVASIKYAVRDILTVAAEAKAAGREMLYLNVGDPNIFDYETPSVIIEAVTKALHDNKNGYAPSDGIPAALAAIRADAEAKGIRNIQDVYISNGCSEGIEIALSALCNEGENILTPSPGYPLYTALVAKLSLEENPYFLDEANGWQPDLEDIARRINDKTRAIVVINPNNPTGSVASRETLAGVIELAKQHGILVIADEIYGELTLDGAVHVPMASIDHEAPILTFDGLSKAYLGPGLRVGWGILSGAAAVLKDYKGAIAQLCRARLSSNHPEQYAIAPALADKSHLPALRRKLSHRRDITVEMLNAVDGISCVPPLGAFYAFPSLDVDPAAEESYIADLIRATGVVVVHGGGFGQRPGTAHFRVVFLPPEATLRAAYTKIGEFVASRR
ncbi:MAG: aminotransferase class I/II-fold pyridoxal phosphate-dependent enzyme [Planctomycetes bacterium]|nr:aminotransferase class I/II-fold pyridoxal phosphate-dependent enzyme [Planctomycetota bacterium]